MATLASDLTDFSEGVSGFVVDRKAMEFWCFEGVVLGGLGGGAVAFSVLFFGDFFFGGFCGGGRQLGFFTLNLVMSLA